MKCQACGRTNPEGSQFCQFCGTVLEAENNPTPPIIAVSTSSPEPSRPPQMPPMREQPGSPSVPRPQTTAVSGRPTGPHSATVTGTNIGQLGGGGTAGASIWGPFAGYGTRGRHTAWLLDDIGDKAGALHEAVTQRFQQREIPASAMKWQGLVAQGILVERRPYYFVRRGITTVALYIAQFGKDLYISQVTYAKGPISNLRVLILVLMGLFQLYFMFGFSNSVANAFYSSVSGILSPFGGSSRDTSSLLALMLCCIGPLGILNLIALIGVGFFSVYKYLTEKDFLAVLRTPPNEFQIDDTVALEKAVEETVRQSLDAIGIDASRMTPTQARDYGERRLI